MDIMQRERLYREKSAWLPYRTVMKEGMVMGRFSGKLSPLDGFVSEVERGHEHEVDLGDDLGKQ
jgi:hypothetical protein